MVALISALRPSRMAEPPSASTIASHSARAGNVRATASPQNSKTMLPALPNSVALPSRVCSIPMCQLPRSIANAIAPSATSHAVRRGTPNTGWPARRAINQITGNASVKRQKPAATGPLSASRTDHGPKASAIFPTISAAQWSPPGEMLCGAKGELSPGLLAVAIVRP